MLDLYKNIRERRQNLNMSQDELAHKVGYTSRSTIARIEKGEIDISRSKILAFAEALKTTPSELMGWSDDDLNNEEINIESVTFTPYFIERLSEDSEIQSIIKRAFSDDDYRDRLLQISKLLESTND